MDAKRQVFKTLDEVCLPDTILASNTSSLCVTEMAASTNRPDKVVGIHFFNPPPMMKLVEIVKTLVCSDETIITATKFAQSIGKTTVSVTDTPGFIVNRLLWPYMFDAVHMMEMGIATAEDIDQGMMLGCNHPMGPLALADLIGIDVLEEVGNILYEELKDPKYAVPPLIKRMVLAGQLGRKSGKGFYDYQK
jgi:3-hydroxybutyryl-CoA dehydrogenase